MTIDYRKVWPDLYGAGREPRFVTPPTLHYLMIDGRGDPNVSRDYAQAIEALFTLSYAIKFAVKRASGTDFRVMPLEGLWWCEDMRRFSVERKTDWLWTMMILQPPEVGGELVEQCRLAVASRKSVPALASLRYESFDEGACAQVLHVGPFNEEGPTVARLHGFIEEHGATLGGKHHEIYLSDIRRAAPEKWRTIVRQPLGRPPSKPTG